MGASEVDINGLGAVTLKATQILRATRQVVRLIGADDRHDLIDALAALGLPTTSRELQAVKAQAAIEQARKEQQ